jgi:uridine kinase
MGRTRVLRTIASRIAERPASPVTLVAVDGVDGAGKTTFADELVTHLEALGSATVRASVDGFHRPRRQRHRRGRCSPEGFFLDSYDLDALRARLLDPLHPGGDLRIVRAIHDLDGDRALHLDAEPVAEGSVLVVDGILPPPLGAGRVLAPLGLPRGPVRGRPGAGRGSGWDGRRRARPEQPSLRRGSAALPAKVPTPVARQLRRRQHRPRRPDPPLRSSPAPVVARPDRPRRRPRGGGPERRGGGGGAPGDVRRCGLGGEVAGSPEGGGAYARRTSTFELPDVGGVMSHPPGRVHPCIPPPPPPSPPPPSRSPRWPRPRAVTSRPHRRSAAVRFAGLTGRCAGRWWWPRLVGPTRPEWPLLASSPTRR